MYSASVNRYEDMYYRRCGNSGLLVSEMSLGLWSDFWHKENLESSKNIVHTAFDNGITHFDLVNNKASILNSAEEKFGAIFRRSFFNHRDEFIISTKANCEIQHVSEKDLIASLDQSLKRLCLDYIDIFYVDNLSSEIALEETMATLDLIVRQGKALYVGVSFSSVEEFKNVSNSIRTIATRHLIYQPKFNIMDSWAETKLIDDLKDEGVICVPFTSLEQKIFSSKYSKEASTDLNNEKKSECSQLDSLTTENIKRVKLLNNIANSRNQSLAQMTIAWLLIDKNVSSVLVGVSSENQLLENINALENKIFSLEEREVIDAILKRS